MSNEAVSIKGKSYEKQNDMLLTFPTYTMSSNDFLENDFLKNIWIKIQLGIVKVST